MNSKKSSDSNKHQTEERNLTNAAQDNTPMIPLPNPGEGGPVYPGPSEDTMQDNTPMIPLPNPEEGRPVYSTPSIPQGGPVYSTPSFPQGGNQMGNMGGNTTMLPNNLNVIGTIISTYPRPNEPCRLCNPTSTRAGFVRFLNAAAGYNPFVVFVNENLFSSSLNFSEITAYEKVSSGTQVVTIMGENGYIFVQKQVEFMNNEYVTIAIINTESGLDIQVIKDNGCDRGANMACVRAANLSYNSGPLTVTIGNQYITFPNLRYQAVANFESAWPGLYIYTVTRNMVARFPGFGGTILLTAAINMQRNRNYTIYLLNWKRDSSDSIKALIIEDM